MNRYNKFILLLAVITLSALVCFFKLGKIPISLHGDEVGVGYNAYTLLTAGIDEYGKSWPIVFRADITPLFFYFTLPAVAVFGLTELAVRIPSAISGLLFITAIYFFTNELIIAIKLQYFTDYKIVKNIARAKSKISLLTALFVSFSPWHIHLSRISHDAQYGILFQVIALTIWFYAVRLKKTIYLYFSFLLFGISLYSYHAPRLSSPLIVLCLLLIFRKKHFFKTFIMGLFFFLICALPLVVHYLSIPISESRFAGISIFVRDPSIKNFYLHLPLKFLTNYISQFNPNYLFFDTSSTRYFNTRNFGLVYLFELPFSLYGLYKFRKFGRISIFVFMLLGIATLPGGLTQGIPNAGRNSLLYPLINFLSAFGLVSLFQKSALSFISTGKLITYLMYGLSCFLFLRQYFILDPNFFWQQWQYGAKEAALIAATKEQDFEKIVISETLKQEYAYVLFYSKKNPYILLSHEKIRHPYIGYSSFGKYEFRKINYSDDKKLTKTLLIGTATEIPLVAATSIINNPFNQPHLLVVEQN